MLKVNGKERDLSGKTISELLVIEGHKETQVVVELNLEIIPKTEYDTTILADDDVVEIVMFMGGGSYMII